MPVILPTLPVVLPTPPVVLPTPPASSASCLAIRAALATRLPSAAGRELTYDELTQLQDPLPPLDFYAYGGDVFIGDNPTMMLGEVPDMIQQHFLFGDWKQWWSGAEPVVEYINQFDSNAAALAFDAKALTNECDQVRRTFAVPNLPGAIGVVYLRETEESYYEQVDEVIGRFRVAFVWHHQKDISVHDRVALWSTRADSYLRGKVAAFG